MKFNLFKKLFLSLSMLMCVTAAGASCSAFFGEDGALVTSIEVVENEDGSTTMTIHFDNDMDPVTVIIPKGEDGNGIEDVTSVYDSETNLLTLTITYENGETKDVSFSPLSIVSVTVENDPANEVTHVIFHYSDGRTSSVAIPYGRGIAQENGITAEPIYLQTGVDDEGNPIYDETVVIGYRIVITLNDGVWDEETGTWTTEPTTYEFEVDTKGRQVSDISWGLAEDGTYTFTFSYTDGGEPTVISGIEPPHATQWFVESRNPTTSDVGHVGDLWFNTENYSFFYLDSITETTPEGASEPVTTYNWIGKGQLRSEYGLSTCYIYFRKGTDDVWSDDPSNTESQKIQSVSQGERLSLDQIPLLEKATNPENYRFLGWFYGQDETNPNIGQFTNLTVVSGSTILYPRWQSLV